MFKYPLHSKQSLLIFALLLLTISCQESSVNDEIEIVDEDMTAGTALAEDYLNSSSGRFGSAWSITVLKYKDGKLLYATSSDDIRGYREITEETVTASLQPGGYMFWFSGGGVSDLESIVFDAASQQRLKVYPVEIKSGRLWVVQLQMDDDDKESDLKYDIIYQFKGNEGAPIVLDPKIKII